MGQDTYANTVLVGNLLLGVGQECLKARVGPHLGKRRSGGGLGWDGVVSAVTRI